VVVRGSTTSGDLVLHSNRHYQLVLTQLVKSDRVVTFDDLSGIVALRAAVQHDSKANTLAELRDDFNALLAKLRASGVIAST
jgi:hypothetical protein